MKAGFLFLSKNNIKITGKAKVGMTFAFIYIVKTSGKEKGNG